MMPASAFASRRLAPSVALWSILFVVCALVACDGASSALDAPDDPTQTPPSPYEAFTVDLGDTPAAL